VRADALAIPMFADGDLSATAQRVDRAMGGIISDMRKRGEIKGRDGESIVIPAGRSMAAKRVMSIGLGKRGEFSVSAFQKLAGIAVRASSARDLRSVAIVMPEPVTFDPEQAGELIAEGAIMGTFDPAPYRTKREERTDIVGSLHVVAHDAASIPAFKRGIARGTVLGEAANIARDMVNEPSNEMRPSDLAQRAKDVAKKYGLKVTVVDRPAMKKLGMGSFLSVAAGSDEPPKMIALEYRGDKNSKTTLGLVGKAITFDTGGISLKPAANMEAMKGDMAGGATVIAVLAALGQLKPKVNVIGVVSATENMPSGHATKPGDIVRAMNGKSIEVTNTDAEGRLVLADGLCWARKLGATHLVDIATLTGAVVIALGSTTTGVMSNDKELADAFHEAARPYGERYWELPLFPEYADLIKSQIADMKNSGGREAGTIYGAMFIKEFVGDAPWIHLDIAGTSWTDQDRAHIVKGPTAVSLRPLVALAESMQGRKLHAKADNNASKRF
jgi:leucyl aminopeptidase